MSSVTDSSRYYQVKRARVYVRPEGATVFRDINTVDSCTLSFQDQTIVKQSTNEIMGEIARKTVSVSGTLAIDMGSTEFENFKIATHAVESAQVVAANLPFQLPIMAAGECFALPGTNVISLSGVNGVEGVDYILHRNAGLYQALTPVTSVTGGTCSVGGARIGGLAAKGRTNYEVIIDDQLNGEGHRLFKWNPDMAQNIALIKPNEFGIFQVTGSLLLDQTKPAGGVYGQFGVKYENLPTT